MKFKATNKHRMEIYTKILAVLSISIAVTIILTSALLFVNFKTYYESTIETTSVDTLTEVGYTANMMSDLARNMALQLYFNETLTPLISYSSKEVDLDFFREMQMLRSYRLTNSYIQSMYIFNRKTNQYYTTFDENGIDKESFFDKEINQWMDQFPEDQLLSPIARTIPHYTNDQSWQKINVFTYIFNENERQGKLENAIIINISATWLVTTINKLNSVPNSQTIILDDSGNSLLSKPDEHETMKMPFIHKILSLLPKSGTFTYSVEGEKAFVTYVHLESPNWTLVRTVPYSTYFNKITQMRDKVLVIALSILLAGLAITFMLSRKLYAPVSNLLFELNSLKQERANQVPQSRNLFLYKLLLNSSKMRMDVIKKELLEYKMKLHIDAPVFLIHLQIDHYDMMNSTYSFSDQKLIRYSMLNIASEVYSEGFNNEMYIPDNDLNFGILIMSEMEPSGIEAEMIKTIHDFSLKAQQSIQQFLGITTTISVSPFGESLRDLDDQYIQVSNLAKYRVFSGHEAILFSSYSKTEPVEQYVYPHDMEKRLLECIKLNKIDEAWSVFLDIIEKTRRFPVEVLEYACICLANAIHILAEIVERNIGDPENNYHVNSFIQLVNQKETIQEIKHEFYLLLESIIKDLRDKNANANYTERNDQIMDYIAAHYADLNLSLEQISDTFGLSPPYLGRVFRKQHQCSVAEYVNHYRLEQAKEMLQTTDRHINEIAVACGFVNVKYFSTLFKKVYGVSPSVYKRDLPNR